MTGGLPFVPTEPEWVYPFTVSEKEQAAFRSLSGDTNPLHHDSDFARRLGFDETVVFGGAIVAKISGFLGSTFPGNGCVWSKLSITFRAPLYVGQQAKLDVARTHSNDDLAIWELSINVVAGQNLIAVGTVQVMRPKEH